MNLLKISILGMGLATLAVFGCSSSSKSTDPVVVSTSTSTSISTSISTGLDAGTGTGTGTGTDTGTVPDGGTNTSPVVDTGITPDAGAGEVGPSACSFTKEGHLAVINAPTTGGLDVTGPTPPAYTTCK